MAINNRQDFTGKREIIHRVVLVPQVVLGLIVWQCSLEVNPSILIGSFLVRILPYRPFPLKFSLISFCFLFSKAIKFQTSIA